MKAEDVFTNAFAIEFDEKERNLLISTIHDKKLDPPITLKLDTLIQMGATDASKWVGETILLLIPEIRRSLFKLDVPR